MAVLRNGRIFLVRRQRSVPQVLFDFEIATSSTWLRAGTRTTSIGSSPTFLMPTVPIIVIGLSATSRSQAMRMVLSEATST